MGAGLPDARAIGVRSALVRRMTNCHVVDAAYELGGRGGVRAVFALGARNEVVHARGEFATEVVYPPSADAMREGWTSVRSSADLLVFVSLTADVTLCGVFDLSVSEVAAVNLLEQLVESAATVQ